MSILCFSFFHLGKSSSVRNTAVLSKAGLCFFCLFVFSHFLSHLHVALKMLPLVPLTARTAVIAVDSFWPTLCFNSGKLDGNGFHQGTFQWVPFFFPTVYFLLS